MVGGNLWPCRTLVCAPDEARIDAMRLRECQTKCLQRYCTIEVIKVMTVYSMNYCPQYVSSDHRAGSRTQR